jgi:hypothetical protein
MQQFNPLHYRHPSPLAIDCGTGGLDRSIYFRLTGFMDQTDYLVVDRRAIFKGFAGGDEFTVDKVMKLFHVVFP